jgi:branched-chain amino acid transport system ATP-binding protein
MSPMLEISRLRVGYGGVPVLHDVSLRVTEGELVAVLGPNGAGKSTLFNAISGLALATSGSIRFAGTDLLAAPAWRRAHLGLAHVPEGRQVFPSLTVLENLDIGGYARGERAERGGERGEGGDRGERGGERGTRAAYLERVREWFPVLLERARQRAGTLSGGEQQMLAIARGLASAPRLLMLDEPSMGLAPAIADEIFERIVAIHRTAGLAVLLVEQRVAEALAFASRAYVLENGRVILEGDHATLANDDRIRQAYLGM